jgi:hypothetical protein
MAQLEGEGGYPFASSYIRSQERGADRRKSLQNRQFRYPRETSARGIGARMELERRGERDGKGEEKGSSSVCAMPRLFVLPSSRLSLLSSPSSRPVVSLSLSCALPRDTKKPHRLESLRGSCMPSTCARYLSGSSPAHKGNVAHTIMTRRANTLHTIASICRMIFIGSPAGAWLL